MKYGRGALLVVGLLALLIGAVWMGQGTGIFPYPASSFMINDPTWVYWGVAMAIFGAAAIFASRRA